MSTGNGGNKDFVFNSDECSALGGTKRSRDDGGVGEGEGEGGGEVESEGEGEGEGEGDGKGGEKQKRTEKLRKIGVSEGVMDAINEVEHYELVLKLLKHQKISDRNLGILCDFLNQCRPKKTLSVPCWRSVENGTADKYVVFDVRCFLQIALGTGHVKKFPTSVPNFEHFWNDGMLTLVMTILPKLHTLELCDSFEFKGFGHLQQVRALFITDPTSAFLREVSFLKNLEYLDIKGRKLGLGDVKAIANMGGLVHLSITRSCCYKDILVAENALDELSKLVNLQFVTLKNVETPNVDQSFLKLCKHLTNLKEFVFECKTLTDNALEGLSFLRLLQKFSVGGCSLTNFACFLIANHAPGLRILDISRANGLNDECLKTLPLMLDSLKLFNHLTGTGLPYLRKLQYLRELILWECNQEKMNALVGNVPETLEKFHMSCSSKIPVESWLMIAKAIPGLRVLNIYNSCGFFKVADLNLLMVHKTLKSVTTSGNMSPLSDQKNDHPFQREIGSEILVKLVTELRELQHLTFSRMRDVEEEDIVTAHNRFSARNIEFTYTHNPYHLQLLVPNQDSHSWL
jgi:hypothetical protein